MEKLCGYKIGVQNSCRLVGAGGDGSLEERKGGQEEQVLGGCLLLGITYFFKYFLFLYLLTFL